MSDQTKIEWCDSTFSPWTGCTKVGPGCDNCYAEAFSRRAPKTIGQWGAGQPRRRTSAVYWKAPLKWNRSPYYACVECGYRGEEITGAACPNCMSLGATIRDARRRVFCASLADVFDNEAPDEWRVDLLLMIRFTPHLDWLLLTKRVGNVRAQLAAALEIAKDRGSNDSRYVALAHWLSEWLDGRPPANVWLGATVVNQAEADRDIPKLLAVPAAKRFLSIEPMLGEIDLSAALWNFITCPNCPCPDPEKDRTGLEDCCRDPSVGDPLLHWVICGSESGPKARRDPNMIEWVRSLRDQCEHAGVAFLWKQDAERGRKIPAPELEGRRWLEFPV